MDRWSNNHHTVDDTQDEHLWFGMGFTRMSQSAALEWIEMLRWSNIDRAPLYHYSVYFALRLLSEVGIAKTWVRYSRTNPIRLMCIVDGNETESQHVTIRNVEREADATSYGRTESYSHQHDHVVHMVDNLFTCWNVRAVFPSI